LCQVANKQTDRRTSVKYDVLGKDKHRDTNTNYKTKPTRVIRNAQND